MKNIYFILAATTAMLLAVSCNKEQNAPIENSEPQVQKGEVVTIEATLPVDSKVTLTPNASGLALAWAEGDVITVAEHGNPSNSQDFTLVSGAGTQSAKFSGTAISAASYDIIYDSVGGGNCASQTQSSDGDTGHLKYSVTLSGASSYENVAFTKEWADANSCSIVKSGALHLVASLPEDVAATVDSVTFVASQNIFNGGNTLAVSIDTPGDAGDKDVLDVYATLRSGDVVVAAGTELLVKFNTTAAHKVYTRYYVFPSAITLEAGKVNVFNLTCTDTDKFAGKANDGTLANPFLVADGYQLAALNSLASTTATTYVKLVDDIDMTGITHTPINEGIDGYAISVNFDGNNKTISKLGKSLFYVFKGTIKDLTLDQCTVTTRGVFAEYCQGTGHSITNVTVTNGSVTYTSSNVGGLIGTINNGSDTCATITDCTVSGTDVTGAGVVGGVVGFADALVSMSGCTYTGGTVKSTARYSGGMLGSTGNYNSVIQDCHVENATIDAQVSGNDYRAGGFIGQLQTKVQVKGCSVGKSGENVIVKLTAPTSGKVYNAGGFAGVHYGTITKNNSVRSSAYATITAGNTATGAQLNLGGFVGYNTGTIEYSDATVLMTGIKGTYIGGFCGGLLGSGRIEHCSVTGTVNGNNYTGGFVGAIASATTSISDCTSAGSVSGGSSVGGFAGGCTAKNLLGSFIGNSSSATVTSSGSNFGGFIGNGVGTFTSNFATGNVISTGGGNGGGFAGGIWDGSTGTTFSKNYATGDVSGNANIGGLIGYIGGDLTMSNCYATGNVGTSTKYNQKYGGLVGFTTDNSTYITSGITITNCYASGDVESSFAGGGLIGRIGLATVSVSKCAAWNDKIYPHSAESANWSTGAVVGVAFPTSTLADNYRNPSMNLTAYWVPADMTSFQHPNVSSEHPLTDSTGAEMGDTATASGQTHYPHYPYHGKVDAGKTLSQLASVTLGWDDEIWEFSGPLPLLK